jgi:hypothetical protein
MEGCPRIHSLTAVLSLVCLLAALPAPGQALADGGAGPVAAKTYGTQDLVYYRIAATELLPSGLVDSSVGYHTGDRLRFPVGAVAAARFVAYPHLPEGARVLSVELDACDEDATDDILLTLLDCDYLGHCSAAGLATVGSGGLSSACAARTVSLPVPYRIDNFLKELLVQVDIPGGGFTGVAGVILGYKLDVSPPPATATFTDVPTSHLYFRAIEALASAGITQGCGGGNFCPNQAVTRGELAKFLANALGLHWR